MAEAQAPPAGRHAAPSGALRRRALRAAVAAILLAGSATVVGWAFVSLYDTGRNVAFTGSDTPEYVWRATVVTERGLGALPDSVRPPFRAQAYRPGHPLMAAYLDEIVGVTPYEFGYGLPAIMAVLVGLGAGALAVGGFGEPRWTFPVYAIGVGASVNVTLTAVGRPDSLIIMALAAAAATAALLVADGRRATAAGIVILVGAALVHWSFALLFWAMLGALALVLVPESLIAWRRRGEPLLTTPAARLGILLGGALALGGGALFLTPTVPDRPRGFSGVLRKLAKHGPRFAQLGPAAAVGVVALPFPRDRRRWRGLAFALIWAGSAAVAVLLNMFVHVPAHRIVPFALGIPILAAAGVTGVARLLARIRPAPLGAALAAATAAVALAVALPLARDAWTFWPKNRLDQQTESLVASRYLEQVGGRRPVVFVASQPGQLGPLNTIRSVLPVEQILRSHAYVGRVRDFVAGRPTREGPKPLVRNSLRHWEAVRPVLERRPIVLYLSTFNPPSPDRLPGRWITATIRLFQGPPPSDPASLEARAPRMPPVERMAAMVALALLLFGAVGLGWAAGLVPTGWLVRLAVAPAIGASVLIIGGVLADPLGLEGPGNRPWIAAVLLALGWLPVAFRGWRLRGGRHAGAGPEPS